MVQHVYLQTVVSVSQLHKFQLSMLIQYKADMIISSKVTWRDPFKHKLFYVPRKSKIIAITRHSGAGTAYTSGTPEVTPVFSGVRVIRSLVLCVCFVDCCLSFCPFSFGHCVVLFFFYLRILITPLVSSNSSYHMMLSEEMV